MELDLDLDKQYFFVEINMNSEVQLNRFVDEGIWELGLPDLEDTREYRKMLEKYKTMRPGDYIIPKMTSNKQTELPFPNPHNELASVMRIYAVGIIKENLQEHNSIRVEWAKDYRSIKKEWYFYTSVKTIWQPDLIGNDKDQTKRLINFSFHDSEQDYNYFISQPFWNRRFGEDASHNEYILTLRKLIPLTTNYNDLSGRRILSINLNGEIYTNNNRKKMMWKELVKLVALHYWDEVKLFPVISHADIFNGDENNLKLHHAVAFYRTPEEVIQIKEERGGSKKLKTSKIIFEGETVYYTSMAGWDAVMLVQGMLNKFGSERESIVLELTLKDEDIIDVESEDIPNVDEKKGQNRILYGPPGTGKTHQINSYKAELLGGQRTNQKDFNFVGLSWKEAIYLAYQEKNFQTLTVGEIDKTEVIQAYAKTKASKVTYGTISTTIIENATVESTNTTYRKDTNLFAKNGKGWQLTEGGMEEAREVIKQFKVDEQETIDYFFELVTFHQSFSYEDFIEGIRAETVDGQIQYEIRKGVFLRFCEKAMADPNNNYLFVIDEINRGNISKVFGELILLIEPSKRLGNPDEMTVTLPYSGESFGVPKNVFILGTMNTADRSIAFMDTALRRRFDFKEVGPDSTLLSEKIGLIDGVDIGEVLEIMNQRIEYLYDRDHTLGHAFFIQDATMENLKNTFEMKIIPLLQEYFYDDYQKIRAVLNDTNEIYIYPKRVNPARIFSSSFQNLIMDGEEEWLELRREVEIEDFQVFLQNIVNR